MRYDVDRSRRRAALALVPVALVLASCGGIPAPKEIPSAAHPLVVLAIDGLGADVLGAPGEQASRAPSIDALAKESVRFEWAWAQAPEGPPSLASLLTGFYPSTHRVRKAGDTLPAEAKTLAEYFSDAGYDTAAFVNGEAVQADGGFAQGFASFEPRPGAGAAEAGARAVAWMRERRGKNFFVLVDASDPAKAGGGDAAIASADAMVGAVVKALRDLGLENRATLVVLGTCGRSEAGGEPLLGASTTHVPLLIRFPGAVRAGTVGENVGIVDVAPTLLETGGIAPPATLQGKSLVPLVRGEGKPPYVAFGESPYRGGQRYVALGGYHMIETAGGARSVYRLADDPGEAHDLAASEAKRVAVLADHLQAFGLLVAASSVDPSQQRKALDDAALEKLKSLGYVQ